MLPSPTLQPGDGSVLEQVPLVTRFGRALVAARPQQMTVLLGALCTPGKNGAAPAGRLADLIPLFAHQTEPLMIFCEFVLHSMAPQAAAGGPGPKASLLGSQPAAMLASCQRNVL